MTEFENYVGRKTIEEHRSLLDLQLELESCKIKLQHEIRKLSNETGIGLEEAAQHGLNQIKEKTENLEALLDNVDVVKEDHILLNVIESKRECCQLLRDREFDLRKLDWSSRLLRWLPYDAADCIEPALIRQNAELKLRYELIIRDNKDKYNSLLCSMGKLNQTLNEINDVNLARERQSCHFEELEELMQKYEEEFSKNTGGTFAVECFEHRVEHIKPLFGEIERNIIFLESEINFAEHELSALDLIHLDFENLYYERATEYEAIEKISGKPLTCISSNSLQESIEHIAQYKSGILDEEEMLLQMIRNCGRFDEYNEQHRRIKRLVHLAARTRHVISKSDNNLSKEDPILTASTALLFTIEAHDTEDSEAHEEDLIPRHFI